MKISAKADYAVRAAAQLAAAAPDETISADSLAAAQDVPFRFLEGILADMRRQGIVASRRGTGGGYLLGRPAEQITVADIIRAVEGPLMVVRSERPAGLEYTGPASDLPAVWVALRANVRAVLEAVTLADLAAHRMPEVVRSLTGDDEAWQDR